MFQEVVFFLLNRFHSVSCFLNIKVIFFFSCTLFTITFFPILILIPFVAVFKISYILALCSVLIYMFRLYTSCSKHQSSFNLLSLSSEVKFGICNFLTLLECNLLIINSTRFQRLALALLRNIFHLYFHHVLNIRFCLFVFDQQNSGICNSCKICIKQ